MTLAGAALVFTWRRLFIGMDLQDESFYILVPWRWALGDKPFVHEQNLAQVSGFLEYPLVKMFGLLRDYDVTGLVLYTRHLYLALMVVVAVVVFLALRRLVRWELALPVSGVYVTFIFWETPQLSYNTMSAALLSLGAALGIWVVARGGGRRWAFASGVAYGLAVVAYPTLLFIMPFVGVFMAFALGERSVGVVADRSLATLREHHDAGSGRAAWRALSWWALGGLVVLVPCGAFVLSFGVSTLSRCWDFTMASARHYDQLGGAPKAVSVAQGVLRFLWTAPYMIVAAALVYLVYLRWPRAGRALLALLPLALWRAGQHAMLDSAGFVLVYALLTPYLYLFVPVARRRQGAVLLYWVWAPALVAGAMTAFTSAAGYLNGPVGLMPAVMASGLFVAWALEAVGRPEPQATAGGGQDERPAPASAASPAPRPAGARAPWLALVALGAVLAVTIVFQFQFQQREVPYRELTRRVDFGPWWGISVRPRRYDELREFSSDLAALARPGDQLLVFYQAPGFYLFWNGGIAADSYWLSNADTLGPLPQSTIDYYRRYRIVPTLAVHLVRTAGMSRRQLTETCGGLGYPPVLVRPRYAFQRKPAGETTADVLKRLPRR